MHRTVIPTTAFFLFVPIFSSANQTDAGVTDGPQNQDQSQNLHSTAHRPENAYEFAKSMAQAQFGHLKKSHAFGAVIKFTVESKNCEYSTMPDSGGTVIVTKYEISQKSELKKKKNYTVPEQIFHLGGTIGGETYSVEDQPDLAVGKTYIVFTDPNLLNETRLVMPGNVETAWINNAYPPGIAHCRYSDRIEVIYHE